MGRGGGGGGGGELPHLALYGDVPLDRVCMVCRVFCLKQGILGVLPQGICCVQVNSMLKSLLITFDSAEKRKMKYSSESKPY